MREANRIGSYTALAAMMVFWGLSFVATKVALESLPPFPPSPWFLSVSASPPAFLPC